jgi:hypothetical protein
MRKIDEDLNALLDDLMTLLATNTGDESHATSIVLVRGVIKPLRRRQAILCLPKLQEPSPTVVSSLGQKRAIIPGLRKSDYL